jgi:hypothetical protein
VGRKLRGNLQKQNRRDFLHDLGAMEAVIQANEKVEPRMMQGYWVSLRDLSEANPRREQVWRLVEP